MGKYVIELKDIRRDFIVGDETVHALRGISFTHFNSRDVVRHPLVARIVEAYEAASKSQEQDR